MENYNCYVFTTKYVLKEKSPIIKVLHEDDGDWQFLGKEYNLKEEDGMLVSFKAMLDFDTTLNDIIDLPIGNIAYRKDVNSPWKIDTIFGDNQ